MYKDKVFESLSSKTPLDLEKVPKTDIEALYKQLFQWASSVQTAGTALKNLKKLVAKNSKEQVKKVVQGRTRLVFIDAKRRQYVKVKGVYMPISELRKT
jgi:hypothetical protein